MELAVPGAGPQTSGKTEEETQLNRTFAALAHPVRRAILTQLARGDMSVNELAAPFPLSQPAVSKHLKVLEQAGLIVRGRNAQWRPSELRALPLREAAEWVGEFRHVWEERLDRLGAYLSESESQSEPEPKKEKKEDA
jgi:DNA-binding transcriptional ArsR family regulator